jgi:cell division protein FtsB
MITMSSEAETIYERVAKLEDEIALLRSEVDILKRALRNKIARHEISLIKKGQDISSIID